MKIRARENASARVRGQAGDPRDQFASGRGFNREGIARSLGPRCSDMLLLLLAVPATIISAL